jgi:hypothetical protein
MRKLIALVALTVLAAGCGTLRKTFGLKDSSPAHREPNTTSVFGNWILGEPDSTAFVGADVVEMLLSPSNFTITAKYPTGAPVVVSGTASMAADGGLLTLTPQVGATSATSTGRFLTMRPGEPISLMASAAGNTLVFAPPTRDLALPSSVWHRKHAAEAAGMIDTSTKQ